MEPCKSSFKTGAVSGDRTHDLLLTKEVPYHLATTAYWLCGMDLNHRHSGYEPDGLPDCPTTQ